MRFQGSALAALLISLFASLFSVTASAEPLDPANLPGLLLSAGRVDTRSDSSGVGSGFFLDGNYTLAFLNTGVSYKNFSGDDLLNGYVGVGFSKLLQLQIGLSTNGHVVTRVRNDFNMTSIYDIITGTKRSRYNTSLGNRLTLTFALENYRDDSRYNNFHIGLGLLY